MASTEDMTIDELLEKCDQIHKESNRLSETMRVQLREIFGTASIITIETEAYELLMEVMHDQFDKKAAEIVSEAMEGWSVSPSTKYTREGTTVLVNQERLDAVVFQEHLIFRPFATNDMRDRWDRWLRR